ncbi:MAG: malate dehydrogenase [Anaerolineaceae bacterium 4572_32.1]|nr:MAG: malate dehydrogenase [Anaerolineaceae bacterium 4572_32.1]
MTQDGVIVQPDALRAFCVRVFEKMDVPTADAEITADVLLSANLRGIDSHGVARLRRYVKGLQNGVMLANPEEKVISETATTALIDAGAGLGQPVSHRAMNTAIDKADKYGTGFVTVRNSNHYGIAGYYAMMALERDMIGISMTNAAVLVVPTFGRDARLGTNPIAVAAPAGKEFPYVLDMATSTVPRGKLEVYNRAEKPLPLGWATDETGTPTADAARVLDNLLARRGGGLLPLGGAGEEFRGYKGYGLALLVDILCGVLPGAGYADTIYPKTPEGKPLPADVGHFFGAIKVSAFRPLDEFKATMDDIIQRMKDTPKSADAERIYIHGEKEYQETERRAGGIPVGPKVEADLKAIAQELGVAYNL